MSKAPSYLQVSSCSKSVLSVDCPLSVFVLKFEVSPQFAARLRRTLGEVQYHVCTYLLVLKIPRLVGGRVLIPTLQNKNSLHDHGADFQISQLIAIAAQIAC